MLVHSLQLRDFRNLRRIDVDFAPGINVIHGMNAQGKTNLLEAVYLLVTGRSFRTSTESELIPWNVEDYQGTLIRATISKASGIEQLAFYLDGKQKRISIDGKPISRLAHLIGRLNAVLFTPADLLLVRGAPALRRRFIDIAVGQTNPVYLDALQTYQYVLKNRNSLLKQIAIRGQSDHQLDVYDEQLASTGATIMEERLQALTEMAQFATQHYATIAQDQESLGLLYEPDVPVSAGADFKSLLATALAAARADDLKRLSTSRGPHRDDFQFIIQQYPARHFASQGQQRSAVLAAKLAEMDYLKKHTGETPLLMLDDLMSELDSDRKAALIKHLDPSIQIFITTTDPHSVTHFAPAQRLLRIAGGILENNGTGS